MNAIASARRQQFEQDCLGYRRQVYRDLLRRTHNEAEAEDMTQNALLLFLEFMERRHWEEDVKNVLAYLRAIATNLYKDWLKNPKEEGLVADDDEQSEQVRRALLREAMENNDPTSRLENGIYYKELYQSLPLQILLGGLSAYELRLLKMDAVDELSTKEIAQVVGADVDKVRYQVNRIHAKIRYRVRRFLEETGGDGRP